MSKMVYRIPAELARTEAVTDAQPERYAPLRVVAQNLSRRGVAVAKVELVNAALLAFTETIFETDPDDTLPNVDHDGRVLIPAPWGRAGGKMWGLRATEQRAFSWLMRQRSEVQNQPLYVYDAEARCWLLGRNYGKRAALTYLRNLPVTLAEWRAAWAATRSQWARQNLGDP